jgi:hypothetical protein
MSEPFFNTMTRPVSDPIFKKLNAELDRAEASVLDALSDYQEKPPASVLVVFKQRYEFKPLAYLLYDRDNLEISVMVDLREGLRLAASQVAKLETAKPAYAISMIAMDSDELPFWLGKGFFPQQEIPASFVGKELLLFTASTASGHVIRRLSELVSSPLLLGEGTRQLGRSVQVQMSHEPYEMDVFWSKYKTVRKQLLEHEERRNYL